MCGGFPPLKKNDEEFYKLMLVDEVASWRIFWMAMSEPSQRSFQDIIRMSKFLNITLTDDEVDRIQARSDFTWMKKNANKFSYAFEAEGVQQLNGTPAANVVPLKGEGVIVKGKDRHGSEELPSVWVKRMKELCWKKMMGRELCSWLKTGGPLTDISLVKAVS
jgi:hypothetical protein